MRTTKGNGYFLAKNEWSFTCQQKKARHWKYHLEKVPLWENQRSWTQMSWRSWRQAWKTMEGNLVMAILCGPKWRVCTKFVIRTHYMLFLSLSVHICNSHVLSIAFTKLFNWLDMRIGFALLHVFCPWWVQSINVWFSSVQRVWSSIWKNEHRFRYIILVIVLHRCNFYIHLQIPLIGYPMWPAFVMDEEHAIISGLEPASRERTVPVQFFGSYDHAR